MTMYNSNVDTVKISAKVNNRSTDNFLWELQKATSYSSGKKVSSPSTAVHPLASNNSGPLVLTSRQLTVWKEYWTLDTEGIPEACSDHDHITSAHLAAVLTGCFLQSYQSSTILYYLLCLTESSCSIQPPWQYLLHYLFVRRKQNWTK